MRVLEKVGGLLAREAVGVLGVTRLNFSGHDDWYE
jgi:hypothetical protein